MANKSSNLTRKPYKIKLCSINIDGLSERSKFMINKYQHSENIDFLFVQETRTDDHSKLEIPNMSMICDPNKASNLGTALYVNEKHSITNLDSISKLSKNIDSCWGLAVIVKKRIILGSVYVKHNYKSAMIDISNMLKAAEEMQKKHKAIGIILSGDFNARHFSWGDKLIDYNGRQLVENLDSTKFTICTSKTPTFMCKNKDVMGKSFIDLQILSNNLVESVITCKTDEEVELFSGAPNRGHFPLITEMVITSYQTSHPVIEKLDISKMKWENWADQIENKIQQIEENLLLEDNPYLLWNSLNEIITEATDTYCPTKRSSIHSKPFWNETLTILSKNLRTARKKFIMRNTESNLKALSEAKTIFDQERKEACQNFIIDTAKQLNAAQARQFWKQFNRLFKKKGRQKVDPLISSNGDLLTEENELDECLFSVFFEAKHLLRENFDDVFYQQVNAIYNQIVSEESSVKDQPQHIKQLNSKITIKEIKKAIKTSGKSVDNYNYHPQMIKHLGEKAINTIQKIFNLCLDQHEWIWCNAEVIFLRKPGKDSYSKPGSYRPICITAYIGKLLETIITNRIEYLLLQIRLTDPHQEGFSAKRNTIRYLSRLNLDIQADREENLTTFGLFVDFEKAFDSVWKKGLMVKLNKLGIQGKVAKLINNFLFTRKVKLNINGHLGENRQSSEYGLPQGSVISPLLFKIYIMDFLQESLDNPNISILKFADDGTIKVSAADTATCISIMKQVLEDLNKWSKKWRLNINCDINKTEIICFNTAEGDKSQIPSNFKLGNKDIRCVTQTKVLGVIIDEDLSYKPHSEQLLKDLLGRWANVCKYCNKHWGFNTYVMLLLLRTLFLSKISYADHVWITRENIIEINRLLYRMIKAITGAVLNIKQSIAELILGVPPILIQSQIHGIKHFLKIINTPVQNDAYKVFLSERYVHSDKTPKAIHSRYKDIFEFLNWKVKFYPSHFTQEDHMIIFNNEFHQFPNLTSKACSYTQKMMKSYTELVWSSSMKNQFQIEGYSSPPTVSCEPIPIPRNTNRETEVKLISLYYKNNLLNQSLYNIDRAPSPMCSFCQEEEETADHLLFRCSSVDTQLRSNARKAYRSALKLVEKDAEPDIYIGLLSACKSDLFVKSCIDIVKTLDIRVLIDFV